MQVHISSWCTVMYAKTPTKEYLQHNAQQLVFTKIPPEWNIERGTVRGTTQHSVIYLNRYVYKLLYRNILASFIVINPKDS